MDTIFLSSFPLKSMSTCKNICFFNKFIYLNRQGMSTLQYKLMISGTFDGCYNSSHTSVTRALQSVQSGEMKDQYESLIGFVTF